MLLRRRHVLLCAVAAALAGCASPRVIEGVEVRSRSRRSLVRQYRLPQSKFAEIDRVNVHYTDEGEGPAVFLMHGNLGSLRMWNDWVGPLVAAGHRVVRMDFPSGGLTGPNPEWAKPAPRESMDRNIVLVEGLMDRLGIESAAFVATSFTGIVAYRMAARTPARVTKLVLINSGGLPRTPETDPNRPRGTAAERAVAEHYFTRPRMATTLAGLMPPQTPPSEALIQEYYDLQNMEGRQYERARGTPLYKSGDVAGTLAAIRQPTLIIWGRHPGLLDTGQAEQFRALLKNAPVTLKIYDGVGHLLPIEAPAQGAADVLAFLEG